MVFSCKILLLSKEQDGMKIDLHVHSSERSACGEATEADQIRAAMDGGLDALVFTDHWSYVPAEHLEELNLKYAPFRIYGGIEVCADGEDFIIIGIRDPALESRGHTYEELYSIVRPQGGYIALVHPFRYRASISADIEGLRPDGMEVYSLNTPEWAEAKIRATADRLQIPMLSNSDAHETAWLGHYYNNLRRNPRNEMELIALLQAGEFSI
jgi:predicted metal-dependent phosphoesterase TrpH